MGADGSDIGEPALDLVGNGQGNKEITAAAVRVLGRRQHRCEVVARVAGFAGGEIRIVEIQVADRGSVEEGSSIGGCMPAAQKCAQRLAAHVIHLSTDRVEDMRAESPNRASQCVEDAQLQRLRGGLRQHPPVRCGGEGSQLLNHRLRASFVRAWHAHD